MMKDTGLIKGSILLFLLLVFCMVLISGCTEEKPAPGTHIERISSARVTQTPLISYEHSKNYSYEDANASGYGIISKINSDLLLIDEIVNKTAVTLSEDDYGINEKSVILANNLGLSPYIENIVLLDSDLIVIAVGSDKYKDVIGSNLSNQDHLVRTVQLKKPQMSLVTQTVEGFPATLICRPVIRNSTLTGVVSAVINPEKIISEAFLYGDPDNRFENFVTQTNGLIIYDEDPLQTGRNTFTDSLYLTDPSIINLARNMSSEPKGNGTYKFHDMPSPEVVTKEVLWDTAGINGGEWRVAVARIISDEDKD